MSLTSNERALLRVSKSRKSVLADFKEGVYLESSMGRAIDDLRDQASADRLQFAESFLLVGDRLLRTRPPMFRIAVGRFYYGMYHAMRAVVYFKVYGDDHEQHSELPTKTPSDFPRAAYWTNELKDARLRRNESDYDPYPADDRSFRTVARDMQTKGHSLATEARAYLKLKGCAYV